MQSAKLNKLKREFNLNDNELTAICCYLMTGNKTWSWKQGNPQSTAKASSKNVLANNYFNDDKILSALNRANEIFGEEIMETFGAMKVSSVPKKEKLSKDDNNKSISDVELSPNMTKTEAIEVLTRLMNKVSDPKQKSELAIKITNLISFERDDSQSDRPIIYLPLRAEDYVCKECGKH